MAQKQVLKGKVGQFRQHPVIDRTKQPSKFPETLVYFRRLRGYKASEIADYLGYSRQTYNLIERGITKKVDLNNMLKVCRLLRIKPADLIPEEPYERAV